MDLESHMMVLYSVGKVMLHESVDANAPVRKTSAGRMCAGAVL